MTTSSRIVTAFLVLFVAGCRASEPELEPTGARTSGLVLADMDLTVEPGDDFYRFANGGWLDANPVPADMGWWGVSQEIERRNELVLRAILEEAAAAPTDEVHRKLGDYYAAGMDRELIERLGLEPIEDLLAAIDALQGIDGMPALFARLTLAGSRVPFKPTVFADLTDPSLNLLYLEQHGISLPTSGYYLNEDDASIALRKAFRDHIARTLELSGDVSCEEHAAQVLAIETDLSRQPPDALDFHDPNRASNRISIDQLKALTPSFDWTEYFRALGVDPSQPVNPIRPRYFQALEQAITGHHIAKWRAYLRWQLLHAYAAYLPRAFQDEGSAFFDRRLRGAQEQSERWKDVVAATNAAMGDALGRAFVERSFSENAKKRCVAMVEDLLAAFRARLEMADWLSESARRHALAKLAAMRMKIGYPDRWRDWTGLRVDRTSYAMNRRRALEFRLRTALATAGTAVDETEWKLPVCSVAAGYDPTHNDFTIAAGILQPPYFSEKYDEALNYGAIGAVIGHEIAHGFDGLGSKFDAHGKLADWWTEADRAEFQRRAHVVEKQFSEYTVLDGMRLNGEVTLYENLADLAGLTIATDALALRLQNQDVQRIDGFTPQQRLYIAWARALRCNYTPALLGIHVRAETHAPAMFRAIGPLSNLQEFQDAFGLPDDAPALRPRSERAVVW